MENYWKTFKEAYSFIQKDEIEKAKEIFEEVYEDMKILNYNDDEFIKSNYVSCLLWLWEVNMKTWNFDKSLEYYIIANDLTEWKDFNVLFNLGVVYRNLWKSAESTKTLNEASKIDSKNPNLIRFLWETSNTSENDNTHEDDKNPNEVNTNFEEKIRNMINNIKK